MVFFLLLSKNSFFFQRVCGWVCAKCTTFVSSTLICFFFFLIGQVGGVPGRAGNGRGGAFATERGRGFFQWKRESRCVRARVCVCEEEEERDKSSMSNGFTFVHWVVPKKTKKQTAPFQRGSRACWLVRLLSACHGTRAPTRVVHGEINKQSSPVSSV